MADQADVNLGSVGFGLVANTDSLERSLDMLTKFSERVNRAASSSNEATASYARQFAQIEKSLSSQFDKIAGVSEKLRSLGMEGSAAFQELNTGFERLTQTFTRNAKVLDPQEMSRGLIGIKAFTDQATRAAKEQEDQLRRTLQQQQALFQAQQRVANVTTTFGIRGAPSEFSSQARASLGQYEAALNKGTLSTEQLQAANQSLTASLNQTMRAFREQAATVNQASSAQLSFARQQQAVAVLNQRASRLNVDPQLLRTNIDALQAYNSALGNLGKQGQATALIALQTALHSTRNAMSDAQRTGLTLSNFMYDFNKATILAAGPLSGFGARVAVMASLLDTGTVRTAFFIASLVGVGYAFAKISINAVKASMDMEKFNALLTSATGASALTGEEFNYLVEQANKLGQRVQGLVQPYANFATAARLSGFSLKEQRNVFESVMIAGAALRFDSEKTGRAFLALEQMVSKGTVQMQELKLQLGQVIPGAMEIAAIAMGKTNAQLNKMMASGDLLAKDFLPKLAVALRTMFGAGAIEGSQILQAQIERLATSTFLFNKALDDNIRISNAVRTVVIGLADSINYLTAHMRELIAIIAAVSAAFLALGSIAMGSALLRLLPSLTAIRAGFAALAAGGVGGLAASLTALIPGLGTVVSLLIRIGLVAGSAYYAYREFSKEVDATTQTATTFIGKANEWADSVNEIGFAHKRTYDQMRQSTQALITTIGDQILVTTMALQTEQLRESRTARTVRRGSLQTGMVPWSTERVVAPKSPLVKEKETELAALQDIMDRLNAVMLRYDKMVTKDFAQGPDTEGSKQWDSWVKRIQKDIREVDMLSKQASDTIGKNQIRLFEAQKKAADVIASMPDKKQGSLAPIIQELAKAGFAADASLKPLDRLRQQLTLLFVAWDQNQAAIQRHNQKTQEFMHLAEQEGELFAKLRERQRAAEAIISGEDPARTKGRLQLETDIAKVGELLAKMGVSTEGVVAAQERYRQQWRDTTGVEAQAAAVEKLKQAIDSLVSKSGTKIDTIWRDYYKGLETVKEATLRLPGFTKEAANQITEQLGVDLWRKLWEASNIWGKKFKSMLTELENTVSEGVADMALNTGSSFMDMIKKMEHDLIAFGTKVLIMRPLFASLFGDLYTDKHTGNLGLIGKYLPDLFGMKTSIATQAPVPVFDLTPEGLVPVGHSGGMIGLGLSTRMVPTSVFAGAPQLHKGGLLSDEVPMIGQVGERVLSKQQNKEWEESRADQRPIMLQQYLYFQDVRGVSASRNQIGASMITLLDQARRNR